MKEKTKIIKLNKGISLEKFVGKVSFENPVKFVINNRPILLININKYKATVLYREVKDENVPSRGHLNLKDYIIIDEGIWSSKIDDYKGEYSDLARKLNSFGIN